MLLTADYSWPNALLGLAGALLVAPLSRYRFSAGQLLYLCLSIAVRMPQAVWEALLIVCLPHRHEKLVTYKVAHARNPWAVFCQTLVITLTPRSLVVSAAEHGEIRIHRLERKESS
jgi:multisubunit Na+/H+ antiporter MnhE subunit